MSAAPDYIEPIVGWRTWLVVQEGEGFRLRSVVYDTLWAPRKELVARCLHRTLPFPWRKRAEHVTPARGCGCGIYAASEPEEAATYLEGHTAADALGIHRVIDTVSLWGPVHRVDARLASLPCLPKDDLRPRDARPLLAQGRAGRRDRMGFRNSVRARRAASARWSMASRFPDSGSCGGLVVGLSGTLPAASVGRAAVQIGAFEGTRNPVAPA